MMRDRVCFFVQSGKFCKREIIAVLKASTMVTVRLSGQWCGLKVGTKQPSSTKTLTAFITLIWLCTHTHAHTHISIFLFTKPYCYLCPINWETSYFACLFISHFLAFFLALTVFVSLFPVSLFSLSIFFPTTQTTTVTHKHSFTAIFYLYWKAAFSHEVWTWLIPDEASCWKRCLHSPKKSDEAILSLRSDLEVFKLAHNTVGMKMPTVIHHILQSCIQINITHIAVTFSTD